MKSRLRLLETGNLVLACLFLAAPARATDSEATLPRERFRSGEEVLRVLAPISSATRYSIVKFRVDGKPVALGTIVETNGLALTKASELGKGKLTCWLADDREVDAKILAIADEDDLALVRVNAEGLTPIQWASGDVHIGQWAITPGIAETPHAIGIVSALPRRIRPPQAFIGVQFDKKAQTPRIKYVLPGLGAEKAGIKPGDIIAAVNSTAVTNGEQVASILSEFRDGQEVKLKVHRAEEEFEAQIKIVVPTTDKSTPFSSIGVRFDLKTQTPKVEHVLPGLGAEKAGIKAGDIIEAVNSTAVTNRGQVVAIVSEFRDGQEVKLRVHRTQEDFEAQIKMVVPAADKSPGFPSERRSSRLRGDVSQRSQGFEQAIEHDTVLQPWLCGGPLLDIDGKAIGLNIARASRVSTYALPASLARKILKDLKPDRSR